MLIDQGGAQAFRVREQLAAAGPQAAVRFSVVETHDGVPCDCIDGNGKLMVLRQGEAVVLTHTCHDGRVDRITATIEAIDLLPAVEHGTAQPRYRP